jgi:hypothetical protein
MVKTLYWLIILLLLDYVFIWLKKLVKQAATVVSILISFYDKNNFNKKEQQ